LPIPPIVQPCAFCGKTFTSRPVDKRRFCSRECADSSRRGETYGKKRTRHFSPRRKQLIRERDGFKCVLCGSDDRLQVDHIIPVRLGGTNDVGNGRTLCHACHVKKTAEDKAAIRARLTQR
jgi:5-methylcytosine-specific restriction endonuclease McrA